MNNESELLKFALENGMLDLDIIQRQIEMKQRLKYLEKHKYNIWKSDDGKFHTYLPDKEKGRIPRKRNTLEELENVIIEYYKTQDEDPKLHEIFYEWINEKLYLKEIGNGTYDRYENDFKRFFKGKDLYESRISTIDEEELEIFIRETIATMSLTNKAFANLRTLIIGMFKFAKRKKYTQISISTFFKDLDLSKKSFTKNIKTRESQVFLEDEIPLIINWLKQHPSVENYGLVLCFQIGVRVGELAGIKFSDVIGKTLHIQRQEIKYKDRENNTFVHEIVEYAKTDAGDRYIILTPNAMETITEIRKLNQTGEFMMQKGGRRFWTNTFNDRIYKACLGCGIQKKSMHKIRKTYGTTLIDGNVDDGLIAEQMGHADINTTRKYYYYSNKNAKHNREQIEKTVVV